MDSRTPHIPLTRRGFLGGSAAFAFLAASGCDDGSASPQQSAKPKRGGTLRVARSEAIDGFELDAQAANATYQVSYAVMEPLLRFDPDGKHVRPGLAEIIERDPSHKSYTLRLAEGASFSDGKPVTSDDVEFSINLWKSGYNYGATYAMIKSVKVLDKRTVRLDLDTPNSNLPPFLTWSVAGIVPKDFGGRSKNAFWQAPIGAGPFAVKHWEAAGDIELVRNKHYHRQGRPYLDSVVNSLTNDANQRSLQFRSMQVDVVEIINPLQANRYPDKNRKLNPSHFTDTLMFNTKKKPFDDVRVRRAIAMAIDYEGIVSGLYNGYAQLPSGMLPPNVGLWEAPDKQYFRQDVSAAKSLLAQADLPGEPIEIVFPTEGGYELLAQLVQRSLQAVGMKVKLSGVETGTFLDKLYGEKHQVAIWQYNAISPDIADPVEWILATNYQFTGYSPKVMKAAIRSYYASKDEATKRAAITRIQDEGEREVPFVALDHFKNSTAQQSSVHGVHVAPWGTYYYDDVWKG